MTEEKTDLNLQKQIYETPVLLELGSLAKGAGGTTCSQGTSPSGTPCTPGTTAAALCSTGIVVT